MNLEKLLAQERTTILSRWFDFILKTYPPETATLLRKETNQFANPVGHTIYHGMEGLYDELLRGGDSEKISSFLDRIIRIRAVQDFSPSQAVSFLLVLKTVVREVLQDQIREGQITPEDLVSFDAEVDGVMLLGFDIYMQCREKLHEVKLNEVKNRTHRLLQRANLIAELPVQKPESQEKGT
jgi:RsbT co-antagonist protein rsbRD N-terminal domain